jgi:hypothetical protein
MSAEELGTIKLLGEPIISPNKDNFEFHTNPTAGIFKL